MQFMTVYLNFNGDALEAFEFYRSVFGGEFDGVLRFRDMGDDGMGVPEADLDRIAHVSLPIANGIGLMGSDVAGPQAENFRVGTNSYIYLEAQSADEADRVFAGLSAGGTVEMPVSPTPWAEKYGTLVDRYGVQWIVSYTGDVEFSL